MENIGRRAAEVLRENAYKNDVTITFELECCGIDRYSLYTWEHGKAIPGGRTLAKMLKMGYDINYILSGVRS